jgi:hypothetical protein
MVDRIPKVAEIPYFVYHPVVPEDHEKREDVNEEEEDVEEEKKDEWGVEQNMD